jgi:hypothetical protein
MIETQRFAAAVGGLGGTVFVAVGGMGDGVKVGVKDGSGVGVSVLVGVVDGVSVGGMALMTGISVTLTAAKRTVGVIGGTVRTNNGVSDPFLSSAITAKTEPIAMKNETIRNNKATKRGKGIFNA